MTAEASLNKRVSGVKNNIEKKELVLLFAKKTKQEERRRLKKELDEESFIEMLTPQCHSRNQAKREKRLKVQKKMAPARQK